MTVVDEIAINNVAARRGGWGEGGGGHSGVAMGYRVLGRSVFGVGNKMLDSSSGVLFQERWVGSKRGQKPTERSPCNRATMYGIPLSDKDAITQGTEDVVLQRGYPGPPRPPPFSLPLGIMSQSQFQFHICKVSQLCVCLCV